MAGEVSELYEPLIERDLDAVPRAASRYLAKHSEDDLWIAIARFAVLAYAPSQHAKRAVVACRSALVVRDELHDRWTDLLIDCACYAAASRQPWSEPPILDPPPPDPEAPTDRAELEQAVSADDRLRAERWLSARIDDCETDLRALAKGDARLMLDVALSLEQRLGRKGRFALLRMPVHELFVAADDVREPLEVLVQRAIEENGSVDAVSAVLIAASDLPVVAGPASSESLAPYHLARDFAQTLIAHDIVRRLPARREEFLAAVHHNLRHGESYANWSFA